MSGFVECTDCRVWSDIPKEFKELKHFVICPKCNNPMYLCRGSKPSDIGLKESQKVQGTIRNHGVNL